MRGAELRDPREVVHIDTPQGTARIVERNRSGWEVWLGDRFLGIVWKWQNLHGNAYEVLLPEGSARAGIGLKPARYADEYRAVLALCGLYARRWREWVAP